MIICVVIQLFMLLFRAKFLLKLLVHFLVHFHFLVQSWNSQANKNDEMSIVGCLVQSSVRSVPS